MKNIEIRAIQSELKSSDEGRLISGLAIPTNSKSELLTGKGGIRFYEIISPFAVNDALISGNDVRIFLDHDESQGTYARSKFGEGSLKLEITERGLEFEFDAPNTAFGDVLLEGIKRSDYDAVSFAFISNPEKEEVAQNEDGTYTRIINEILWLGEISILSQLPAYDATDVNVRSFDNFIENRNNEILSNLDKIYEEFEKNI